MASQIPTARSSSTVTIEVRPQPALRPPAPSGTLRLRAEPAEERHIQWADDVVDNEGMGKKSSKVCCIYHKPREVGESSDESSSDESSSDESSDSNSDSEPDNSTARPIGGRQGRNPRNRRPHDHNHGGHDDNHNSSESPSNMPKPRGRTRRKHSPNAYEKMPKPKK